jgi:hypothetical protein
VSLRQTTNRKLFPELGSALDELSLRTPDLGKCSNCGNAMVTSDAQFWLWGRDEQWNLKLPLCTNCDAETIQSLQALCRPS